MIAWENMFNKFAVCAVHYTADPDKRSEEWYAKATEGMRYDQIQREMEIDFQSRAGQKAFWFLEGQRNKYRIPNIPLDNVPKHWRIIAGLDYGSREPTAIILFGIDEYRRFYALWEFYKPSHYKEIARALKGTLEDNPHPLWPRIEKIMADPSMFRNDQENPMAEELQSRADLLRNEGIWNLYRGTNDRLAGLERIKEMFAYFPNQPETKAGIFFCERCEKTWWELTNIVYDEIPPHLMMERNAKEDVKQKNDHCFPGVTLVNTMDGLIKIQDIVPGILVLTRDGYRPVAACGKTGISETVILEFTNGKRLECTPNHPIFTTNRGFIRADELGCRDGFLWEDSLWKKKRLFSKESFLGAIQNLKILVQENTSFAIRNIFHSASAICTGKYGKSITDRFLKTITFTISIWIRQTMTYGTFSAYPALSMPRNTGQNYASLLPIAGPQGSLGASIVLFAEKNFIQRFLRPRRAVISVDIRPTMPGKGSENKKNKEQHGLLKRRRAFFAKQSFLEKGIRRILAALTVAPRLSSIRKGSKQAVYNLSVSGKPEYFADGILVHNCYDSARYALMSVESPSDKPILDVEDRITLDSVEKQLVMDERQDDND